MPRFYHLVAGLALLSFRARAQALVTNLLMSNITATSATITFDGYTPLAPFSCSSVVTYLYVGAVGLPVRKFYAIPLQLTGLQPARTIEVRVVNTRPNPEAAGQPCLSGPAATVTFTTLAATPAADAGQLSLAPTRDRATLTLAAA